MATVGTAVQALLTVGQKGFESLGGAVPIYGNMYINSRWIAGVDFESYSFRTVCIYENNGRFNKQGLGYSKEWLNQTLRLDIFMPSAEEARQAFQKLREFWIEDFDYPFSLTLSPGNGTVGKGYLRQNGIKSFTIGPDRALPIERGGNVFRRIADLSIEIGD